MSINTTNSNPSIFILHILSIFFIGFTIFQLFTAFCKLWRSKSTTTTPPPGRCGFPLIGETLAFLVAKKSKEGLYGFVKARRARYGNCFKTNIFQKTHVFMSSFEASKMILGDESAFTKTYIRSIVELLGENSVLCSSRDQHRIIRYHMSNLLHKDMLMTFIKLFDELTVEAQNKWTQKDSINVLEEAFKITFRAICKTLLSLDNESEQEILQKDVFLICEAMLGFPLRLPWTRYFKGLQARKRIMKTLGKIINERRKGIKKNGDFLQTMLMNDNHSSKGFLNNDQIQDNILTLIIAGQITTSSAIAWMVKYLDENLEVQEKLRNLQLSLEKKLNCSREEFGYETLNEMTFASKVVKETLRMSTIVSWFPMLALKDIEIEGFHIKKGWIVNVDARYIHYDDTLYENPTMFNPSRFEKQEDPKPYSFLAFGTGGRTCLGMNLAKAMMMVFLHRLVTTYKWEVTDHDASLEKHSLFPRLRSGCPIKVTPISQSLQAN